MPIHQAMLGWLGVFLTGSDTSANALFGNLQVVTANNLGLDPSLMAAGNSSGGVMGKMISLQSIAVAAAVPGQHWVVTNNDSLVINRHVRDISDALPTKRESFRSIMIPGN